MKFIEMLKPSIHFNLNLIDTTEIKQIVDGLNRPPFMCNLSLVEFDDKPP